MCHICKDILVFFLLRRFLQSITPYLTEGIVFLANIVHPVRVSYKCLLTDHSEEERKGLLCSLSEDCETPEISSVKQVRCLIMYIYCDLHGQIEETTCTFTQFRAACCTVNKERSIQNILSKHSPSSACRQASLKKAC